MEILDELKNRKILNNITDESLFHKLKSKKVYIGFDPTYKSLHLGNYIQISILQRFKKHGYEPIALIGGATGYIGDPSGKSIERKLLSKEEVSNNSIHIQKQLQGFGFKVINNSTWYNDFSILDFLRDVGKLLNVNYMLAKDSVKSRLETGISFTEFSYQLLQAWDFKKLNSDENVSIQIGGSDQWGNITSGLEVIRKTTNNDAVGITTNLLLNSSGKKFGKSENGAIFLDGQITSPFTMYQYFYNQLDADIEQLLYWFSLDSLEKINEILLNHKKDPKKRIAQQFLADSVVTQIHGQKKVDEIHSIRINLFFSPEKLTLNHFKQLELSLPNIYIKDSSYKILDLLIELGAIASKRNGRDFIKNGSIKINNQILDNENHIIDFSKYFNKYAIISKGKKYKFLIIKK